MALPVPTLDDKSFEQLVEDAKRLIPVFAPDWTDHNLHDPGITFLELFVWLAEMQQYSLDRVTPRHLLKYLKLLGVEPPRPPRPAQVDVSFTKGDGILRKGTQVVGKGALGEEIVFQTDRDIDVLPVALAKIFVRADYQFNEVTEFGKPNPSFFFAFGARPQPGSTFYLGFNRLPAGRTLTMKIRLSEQGLPPIGEHDAEDPSFVPSAVVQWEYWSGGTLVDDGQAVAGSAPGEAGWRPLPLRRDETGTLYRSGIVSFRIPMDTAPAEARAVGIPPEPGSALRTKERGAVARQKDAPLCWLRCSVQSPGWEIPPRVERLLVNTVSATEGEKVKGELTLPERGTGLPNQVVTTSRRPLSEVGVKVTEISKRKDAVVTWAESADFDSSNPWGRHFTADYQNGRISFGDGLRGRVPAAGELIRVSYRTCRGELGNVREGVINEVKGRSFFKVENFFPATGGRNAETILDAFARARKELQVQYSAVTSADLEAVAKATPGLRVARAKVIVGEDGAVTVVVVPFSLSGDAYPSRGFCESVCRHLERHRLITTRIKEVTGPLYVAVSVSAVVKSKKGYKPDEVAKRCREELNAFLAPLSGSTGEGWPFGRTVFRSEVYAVLEAAEGVDGVTSLSIAAAKGEGVEGYLDGNLQISKTALVCPGSHRIEVAELSFVCGELR